MDGTSASRNNTMTVRRCKLFIVGCANRAMLATVKDVLKHALVSEELDVCTRHWERPAPEPPDTVRGRDLL